MEKFKILKYNKIHNLATARLLVSRRHTHSIVQQSSTRHKLDLDNKNKIIFLRLNLASARAFGVAVPRALDVARFCCWTVYHETQNCPWIKQKTRHFCLQILSRITVCVFQRVHSASRRSFSRWRACLLSQRPTRSVCVEEMRVLIVLTLTTRFFSFFLQAVPRGSARLGSRHLTSRWLACLRSR